MDYKKQVMDSAIKAMKLSYSPYSNFAVGAAIITKDGTIYQGANIENAAYGVCMCGERNAIYNAYCNGETKETIEALAIVADTPTPCSPCGACRQVISELLKPETKIYLLNLKGDVKETNPVELLPFAFNEDDLK